MKFLRSVANDLATTMTREDEEDLSPRRPMTAPDAGRLSNPFPKRRQIRGEHRGPKRRLDASHARWDLRKNLASNAHGNGDPIDFAFNRPARRREGRKTGTARTAPEPSRFFLHPSTPFPSPPFSSSLYFHYELDRL